MNLLCILLHQVGILENVMGFMPLLSGLKEVLHENLPGYLACTELLQ